MGQKILIHNKVKCKLLIIELLLKQKLTTKCNMKEIINRNYQNILDRKTIFFNNFNKKTNVYYFN